MCTREGDGQLAEPKGGGAAAHRAKCLAVPKPLWDAAVAGFPPLTPTFSSFHSPVCPVAARCSARPWLGGGHVFHVSLAPSTHGRREQ